MRLPSLPSDVWQRISTLLDPPDLSSMSQVSQTFYKIATDESHFRRHLEVPQPSSAVPSVVYRRLCAFSYPPSSTTLQLSADVDILCIVEDILILLDKNAGRLISFPNAQTADIDDLVGKRVCLQEGLVNRNLVKRQYAVLPGARMAFLKGSNPTLLTILEVKTWDITKHEIPGRRRAQKALLRGSRVFVAGNHGEWIIYHIDNETVALVDWQRGKIIRRIRTPISKAITWKWLMGTCAATNDRSIVGMVRLESNESKHKIYAEGFEGKKMTIHYTEELKIYCILRSADMKTHVLITRDAELNFGQLTFHAYREHLDSGQTWTASLVPLIYTKLLLVGNVIEARPQGHLGGSEFRASAFSHQFIVLKEDGVMERIWYPRLSPMSEMIWCKRTSGSGLVVIGGKSSNRVEVQQLRTGFCGAQPIHWRTRASISRGPLHSLFVEGLNDVCVIADHVIFATRRDGQVQLIHFDRFCPSSGVFACPWTQGFKTFQYPEIFGSPEPDSPARKKRKTLVRTD